MRFITSHLRHLKRLISWHLRSGEIDCSRAAEFEPGNVSREDRSQDPLMDFISAALRELPRVIMMA